MNWKRIAVGMGVLGLVAATAVRAQQATVAATRMTPVVLVCDPKLCGDKCGHAKPTVAKGRACAPTVVTTRAKPLVVGGVATTSPAAQAIVVQPDGKLLTTGACGQKILTCTKPQPNVVHAGDGLLQMLTSVADGGDESWITAIAAAQEPEGEDEEGAAEDEAIEAALDAEEAALDAQEAARDAEIAAREAAEERAACAQEKAACEEEKARCEEQNARSLVERAVRDAQRAAEAAQIDVGALRLQGADSRALAEEIRAAVANGHLRALTAGEWNHDVEAQLEAAAHAMEAYEAGEGHEQVARAHERLRAALSDVRQRRSREGGLEERVRALEERLGMLHDERGGSLEERVEEIERRAVHEKSKAPKAKAAKSGKAKGQSPMRWRALAIPPVTPVPPQPSEPAAPPPMRRPRFDPYETGAPTPPPAPAPPAPPTELRVMELGRGRAVEPERRREVEEAMRRMRAEMERLREEMEELRQDLGQDGLRQLGYSGDSGAR